MKSTVLSESIEIPVESVIDRSIFSWNPSSPIWSAILHGLFTTFALNEVIAVTRSLVKGSSSSLRVNRTILWSMVENWEDLGLMLLRLCFQEPLHKVWNSKPSKQGCLTRAGYIRFLVSFMIALWLFGAELALIVLSAPSNVPLDASMFTKIQWLNDAKIPKLTYSNVLDRSLARTVKLLSRHSDIEFIREPIVSLERTNLRSFGFEIPPYNGVLFSCNTTETVFCTAHCEDGIYLYQIKLHVVTTSYPGLEHHEEYFLVPTDKLSVTGGTMNHLKDYAREIEAQLNIEVDYSRLEQGINRTTSTFEIRTVDTTNPPPADVTLPRVSSFGKARTCDAIATLFLGSIAIEPSDDVKEEYLRVSSGFDGKRKQEVDGFIAVSRRPFLPILGTILFFIVLQISSLLQQKGLNLGSHSNDLTALLEVTGGDYTDNIANIHVEDRPLVSTSTNIGDTRLTKIVSHVGYLPASIVVDIDKFLKETGSDAGEERFKVVGRH